jgi:hypothetical protein
VAALLQETPSLVSARDEAGTPVVFYLHPEMERLDEMVRVLSAHGADFNVRDTKGKTLLDHAFAHGWTAFADVLRGFGARTAHELTTL